MRDTSVIHTVPYADMIYVSGWLIDNILLFDSIEAKKEIIKRCMKIILYYVYYQSIGRNKDDKKKNEWQALDYEYVFDKADEITAIQWRNKQGNRILFFNATVPLVKNNIDICLYQGNTEDFDSGNIVKADDKAIMFGELKGGIDPAGADEHWKTGNSALERIREAFAQYAIKTSFIAAAIERKMATEIYAQLQEDTLSNAANLTVDEQLTAYCNWMINL